MKNKILHIILLVGILTFCVHKNTKAQHVLNGSFEINDNQTNGIIAGLIGERLNTLNFKYVEYIVEDTNRFGGGYIVKDTMNWWDDPLYIYTRNIVSIKPAPHGKTYITIDAPIWGKKQQVMFLLSDSLTIGKRYIIRFYSGNRIAKTPSSDKITVALSKNNKKVGQEIDNFFIKDSLGYREYVTSFIADSNYKYIYLYITKASFLPSYLMIDHIHLDTCVQLAKTQYIGCANLPELLKPSSISADNKYYWSTGDTTPTIYAQNTGNYRAYSYDNNGCVNIDSFVISFNQTPGSITKNQLCSGDSLTLKATPTTSIVNYSWNTGDTTASINITKGGTYWVTRGAFGCFITDSFYVTETGAPSANYSDTFYCTNAPINIGTTDAQNYIWNTNAKTPQISVNKPGKYWVVKTNPPCQNTDTFTVTEKSLPEIKSVKDTVVCFDQVAQILLDAGQFKSYVWKPTNETSRIIYSNAEQVYLLQVTDTNNCVMSKQITVTDDCPEHVYIPNAFSPNNDGLNDVFNITTNTALTGFEMQIFNRWGILVFNTNNYQQGWDGKNAPSDVYVVQITYKQKNKQEQSIKGNVTLFK